MTLSQIRNQVHSLQRQFAKDLAVFRLRQLAEEIADDWETSMAEKEELPQPHQVVQRVAAQGHILKTYMNLNLYVRRCLDQGKCLIPQQMVLALLPWARNRRYDDILYGEIPTPTA
ncbi:MAG: hypothetical protein F4X65_04070 [Chloroflexi bacterium]|nr:hypothetical protein [Chloroflexota bacterium]